jgi:hypothetical protein
MAYDVIYQFHFQDSCLQEFTVRDTASCELNSAENLPQWTELEFHQCSHCPLQPKKDVQCPLAASLASIADKSSDYASHEPVEAHIVTPERTVMARTTVQRAFSSLMGLLVVTSGCPHTAFLKPMARFHLPFSTEEETVYRAVSMYLLAQYFRLQQRLEPDFELSGLKQIYRNLQIVNQAVAQRLRAAAGDSMVNALVLLDLFAKSLPYAITERLEGMHDMFGAYLRQDIAI